MSAARTALPLAIGVLALGSFLSCDKYEAPEPKVFHETFDWGPAHGPSIEELAYEASIDTDGEYDANNFCDKCHIAAAELQVAEGVLNLEGNIVEFAADDSNWVTVPSQFCHDCHPLVIGIDTNVVCPPGATSEWCKYQEVNVHPPAFEAQTCTGGACHQLYPPTTWQIGGGPGNENPHEVEPLLTTFPLDGGHSDATNPLAPGCTDCHSDLNNPALEAGYGAYCGNCHSRTGEGQPPTHYEPDRIGWTDERERDCFACHANVEVGQVPNKLLMPDSWAAYNTNHTFRVPHYTVQDWDVFPDVIANGFADWKTGCESCHDAGTAAGSTPYVDPADDRMSCGSCHDLAQLEIDYSAFHTDLVANPSGCHQAQCHPSGTIEGENEPN